MLKQKIALILLICCFSLQSHAQQSIEVKGVVTSAEDNETLIGASVKIKGIGNGVVTDIDGAFTISVQSPTDILLIEYLGMESLEVPIPANRIVNVALKQKSLDIEEVVVTGYGNFSKSSFTGSASTLRTDMLKSVPVVSIEQKLSGMVTGVNIAGSSGQPGANQSIRIRGLGSFSASKEPLFVVDGVPVISGNLSSGSSADASYMNDAKTNVMSTLNPSDIENVTIIKDAAAASLYGSRAANGVILITTKKGTTGKTSVILKASGGFSNPAVEYRPSLNGIQRREIIYEGLLNYAKDQSMKNPAAYADGLIDTYAGMPALGYTDWRKELIRNATTQNYEVIASGGSDKTTFYSSLGFNRQQGLVENSNLDRYSTRLNLTHKLSKRAELGANVMFSQIEQEMNEERGSNINPFMVIGVTGTPSFPVRDEEGNYVGSYPGTDVNPLRDIRLDYNRSRLTRMFSTGYATFDIIEGLKLKETLSYDYNIQKDSRYWNALSGAGPKNGSDAQTARGFVEYSRLISSTSLNWIKSFGKHKFDVLAGYELENYQRDMAIGDKAKLPSELLEEPANAAEIRSFDASSNQAKMISYLSRANYTFDDRYFLAASYRRDGTSRLSPKNRWGDFWSASAMWNISEETFFSPLKSVVSDLKLRASYGVNGNQPGGYYGFMGLYSYNQNYMGEPGSFESNQPNPKLKWEKNYNLNLGLDAAFFKRIFLSLEYYNRDTKDLLYNRPISATTGFLNYLGNLGQINNKGIEAELRSINIQGTDFNWTTVLNLTHNKNKIIALDGISNQSISGSWFILKEGFPYSSFYVKEFAGVDRKTGKALYYKNTQDENGNYNREVTTDGNAAQAIPYKAAEAKITGGLTNLLTYKDFNLGFTITYSLGGYSYDKAATLNETDGANESYRNLPVYQLDRWQQEGDITNIPRFVLGQAAGPVNSSRYIHSTDHLRLKNITFGYTLPAKLTQKAKIDQVRLFFSGSNLLTWAKWNQYDPEVPISGQVYSEAPPMRTYSFGIELFF